MSGVGKRHSLDGRRLIGLVAGLAVWQAAFARPPVLTYVHPAGGKIGATFDLKLEGSPEGPGRGVWTDCPGLIILPAGKDKGRAIITDDAQPGLHLIRTFNSEGASAVCWFSIGAFDEAADTEPNDAIGGGQKVSGLPVCINGRLDKGGDVDGFAVEVGAGVTLVAAVEAYALGSPVDAVLNLLDEKGVRIATVHDSRSLDPVLVHKAEKAGKLTVQLSGFGHPPRADVSFTGGPAVIYRLTLADGPAVTRVFPPVVQIKAKTKLSLSGGNLPEKDRSFEFDGARLAANPNTQEIAVPNGLWPMQVVVSKTAPVIEKEPNDQAGQATAMSGIAAGAISTAEDKDRFSFVMKKGERFVARVYSREIGLPLDAALRIEGPDGKTLASNDGGGEPPDPQAVFTAPADGAYQAVVSSLFGKGGDDHVYAVEIGPEESGIEAELTSSSNITLAAGKTAEVTAKVRKTGTIKEPLAAIMQKLPPGIFAETATVSDKGEVKLVLAAAADARPSSGPVQLAVFVKSSPPSMHSTAKFQLRGEDKRGRTLRDQSSDIWLTVMP